MFKTLVIIPAFNEERNIEKVIAGIKTHYPEMDVLVVNDGSTDKTAFLAKKSGAGVISLPNNLGYGGALQTGFKYAVLKEYDYVIQFDGDDQHDPADLERLHRHLIDEHADIVIGSRFLGKSSFKTGLMKKFAISFFRMLIRRLTGMVITDPTSGFQGLSRKVFGYYSIKGNFPGDYPDADILIHMLKCDCRICEIPVHIRRRAAGKSMHSGLKPIYYFIKVLLSILIIQLRNKYYSRSCEYYE